MPSLTGFLHLSKLLQLLKDLHFMNFKYAFVLLATKFSKYKSVSESIHYQKKSVKIQFDFAMLKDTHTYTHKKNSLTSRQRAKSHSFPLNVQYLAQCLSPSICSINGGWVEWIIKEWVNVWMNKWMSRSTHAENHHWAFFPWRTQVGISFCILSLRRASRKREGPSCFCCLTHSSFSWERQAF